MMRLKTAGRLPPVFTVRGFLRSFSHYIRANAVTFLLGFLFLLGVLIGTLLVRNASEQTLQALKVVLGGFVEQRQMQSFGGIILSSFSSLFSLLIALFFCGFCSIAQPIILIMPIFKGLGYGFSIGTLYMQYGASAISYVAALMLPSMFFSALLLITASRSSLLSSVALFRTTLIRPEQAERYRAKRYCIKFGIFTVLCFFISLTDAILFYKFSSLFIL